MFQQLIKIYLDAVVNFWLQNNIKANLLIFNMN